MGLGLHANLGFAWLFIGGLRFHLLLSCDDLDPAMKYSWKCSQLEEKISLLELEIKVFFFISLCCPLAYLLSVIDDYRQGSFLRFCIFFYISQFQCDLDTYTCSLYY